MRFAVRPAWLDAPVRSGYHLARMRHEILLSPEAVQDLRRVKAYDRARVRDALESYLRSEPMKLSKSRIKRLRGMARPQYRLRVGEFRAFYDVVGGEVHVLAIVSKASADQWLREAGTPDEESGPFQDKG